jgi:hypothetical protein
MLMREAGGGVDESAEGQRVLTRLGVSQKWSWSEWSDIDREA